MPHVLHAEFREAILASGKHFLGEEPLGMDFAQNGSIMAALDTRSDRLLRG